MDEGIATPEQISLAKRDNIRVAHLCAGTARKILGVNGISLDYSLIRTYGEHQECLHISRVNMSTRLSSAGHNRNTDFQEGVCS